MRTLVGTILAGIICAGWTALGVEPAPAAEGDDQDKVASGALNPAAEKTSQASALYASALARESSGDKPGAIAELRQAVTVAPNFAEAQLKLATLLLEAGQTDAADSQLQAAIAAHADPAAVNVILEQVEAARGHVDKARSLSDATLARDSASTESMRVLLKLGEAQKGLSAAVAHVLSRLQAGHAPVDSYLALDKIYLEITGRENPAPNGDLVLKDHLAIYQAAAKAGAPTVDLLTALADTYGQLNEPADALLALRQAQKIDPHNVELVMRSATFAADAGDSDGKVREYKKAYALEPQREGLRASLASAYFEDQKYPQAFALMKEMARDTPDDAMLLIRLAVTSETLRHPPQESRAFYARAIHSPELTLDAALRLTAFFIDQQRVPEAAKALAVSLKKFPASAQLHFYAAVQKMAAGDAPAALVEYDEAGRLAGQDPSSLGVNFYQEGAMILAANNQHDKVGPLLQGGLQKFPDDPNLLNQEAWEWADQGTHLDQAMTAARQAVALSPDNGSMLDTLGYVELKEQKPADALPVLQRAAKMTNNDPSILQHLGDAYLAVGRRPEAMAAWRLGLQKDSGNRDLNQRLNSTRTPSPHVTPRSASP